MSCPDTFVLMKLGNNGYLSANREYGLIGTGGDSKKWFGFVDGLNRTAMKMLDVVEPDPKKNQELCAALFYRRALQMFQGAILLAERGMIADALTLVRSCAETGSPSDASPLTKSSATG